MTIEDKSIALMEWLEANRGEAPPDTVEPKVIEAVYALRPDLAPKPSVDVAMILDKIEEGPFAEKSDSVEMKEGDLVSLNSARKSRQTWGRMGLLAAAAVVLVVVVPLKDDAAVTRAPIFQHEEETEALRSQQELAATQSAQESSTNITDEDEFIRDVMIAPERPAEAVTIDELLGVRGGQNSESQAGAYNDRALESEAIEQVRSRSYTPRSQPDEQSNGEGGGSPPETPEPTSNYGAGEQPQELDITSEFNEVEIFGTLGSADAEISLGQMSDDSVSRATGLSTRSSDGAGMGGAVFGASSRGRSAETSPAAPPPEVAEQAIIGLEAADETSPPTSYPSRTTVDFESVPIEEDVATSISSEELTIVIEHIEELLKEERFEEALRATRLNRPTGEAYPSLLKQLWLMEAQALTALGRTEEAESAMTEANKL